MSKSILTIAAMCACSLAGAATQNFEVEYVGFHDAVAGTFDPTARLSASFTVEDRNGDGSYTQDELLSFGMDRIYVQGSQCDLFSCVHAFNYTPGSLPNFTASYYMSDERFAYSTTVASGDYYDIWDRYIEGDPYIQRLEWTAATQTWVNGTLVPVPEPSTYAMLGLGLGALLMTGRRRQP